jgi:hypothetical protein
VGGEPARGRRKPVAAAGALGDFGEVYLLDWGLAKLFGVDEEFFTPETTPTPAAPAATAAGSVLGTPGYMAPEQIDPNLGDVTPATDVYALGAVLFEILSGEPYINAQDPMEATVMTLRPGDPHPAQRAPGANISPALDQICAQALARDPAARQQSVRALADAVDRFLAGEDDLERRRELSRRHVAAARIVAPTDEGARARALNDLGSAIALDPDNRDARAALVELLTRPPLDPPVEVRDRLAEDFAKQQRLMARMNALTSLTFYVFGAAALALGVAGHLQFFMAMTLVGISTALHFVLAAQARPSRALELIALVPHFAANLFFVQLAGWLALVPGLLVALAAARQAHPSLSYRRLSSGFACVVLAAAFFLDRAMGLTTIVDGGFSIAARMLPLDDRTMWFLFFAALATNISPAVALNRTRLALERAERELQPACQGAERIRTQNFLGGAFQAGTAFQYGTARERRGTSPRPTEGRPRW